MVRACRLTGGAAGKGYAAAPTKAILKGTYGTHASSRSYASIVVTAAAHPLRPRPRVSIDQFVPEPQRRGERSPRRAGGERRSLRHAEAMDEAARLDRATKQRLVDEISHWHHAIDLGDDVVTPGHKTPHHFYDELRRLRLPDMANRSVLDIGAWDGFQLRGRKARGVWWRSIITSGHSTSPSTANTAGECKER